MAASLHPLQVFNISGERYVTFDGLARACAKAMGAPEPEIIHFNAKDFDFGKKKVRSRIIIINTV
jgi:nucleoside-diphosphate-sugar epimerase